jgi:ribulose-phosphate 3-epimerase
MIIAPSILSADFSNLGRDISAVVDAGASGYMWMSWTASLSEYQHRPGRPESIRKTTPAFLDCHLMIIDPERYIDEFANAGADGITVRRRQPGTSSAADHDQGTGS